MTSIFGYLRSCAFCGCNLGFASLFCAPCATKFERYCRVNGIQKSQSCQYRSEALLSWEKSDWVQFLLLNLKGSFAQEGFLFLARVFLWLRHIENRPSLQDWTLVPSPPTCAHRRHAHVWADTLSGVGGYQVRDILVRHSLERQTFKSAQERANVKFSSSQRSLNHLIFVDDVVTTGATARAAYEALGRPTHFLVWTVACRNRPVLL